jgi:hypothetical protein
MLWRQLRRRKPSIRPLAASELHFHVVFSVPKYEGILLEQRLRIGRPVVEEDP